MRTIALLLFLSLTLPLSLHADIKGKKKPGADKKKISLMNTYWRLSEMNGKSLPDISQQNTPYIYLQDKKNQLLGNTGCNNIGGEFASGKYNYVGFEPVYTEMACPDMSTESYLLNALKGANRYKINGNNLLLYKDDLLLAVFEAK
jgi:putative lipoprotein